jgi:predicted peroxiredoxin
MALLAGVIAGTPSADDPQKIVVHLKHYTDDLHAAFMAVKLAGAFKEKGADVTMFVNLEGVRLVDRGTPLDMKWGHSKELTAYFESYINAGGTVLVCPHCAMAAGLEAKDLREGARIGTEQEVVDLMLAADKILDY